MTKSVASDYRLPSDSAIDCILKMLRYLGMLGFLGGLAALSAMWAFGPRPENLEQWRILIGVMRPIFYACFFAGIVVLAIAGGFSWWRHRSQLHSARWFRVMMVLVIIAVPTLHLSARGVALRLYAAINENRLSDATELWNQLGRLYVVGFVVMLIIASIGVVKPRFGQPSGRDSIPEEHG